MSASMSINSAFEIELEERTQDDGEQDHVTHEPEHGLNEVVMRSSCRSTGTDEPDIIEGRRPSEDIFTEDAYSQIISTNQYHIRKLASQTLMDVALMMANISQLRTLISLGDEIVQYYQVMVVMVIVSMACQVTFAILMFIIWIRESDQNKRQEFYDNLKELEQTRGISLSISKVETFRHSQARRKKDFEYNLVTNRLNHCTMILIFFITVTNMFITGFGIKTNKKSS